ncbi:MAG: DUF6502 family protein [Gammaproteobacteria bacterium]|nr:DUF6502 family protein [Gammaproteobacteria bacterium]
MERIPDSACRRLTADLLLLLGRFWLHQGLNGLEAQELLRWAMVRTALDDPAFSVPGRLAHSATLSRAAVLTGLPRREVQRLAGFAAPPPLSTALQRLDRVQQVITRWQTDRRFRGCALDVRGKAGNSFAELVRSCCRDVPPRAIRDELLLQRKVRWRDAKHLELVPVPERQPSATDPDMLEAQRRTLLDLLETGLQRLGTDPITGGPSISERKQRDALLDDIERRLDAFAGDIRALFESSGKPGNKPGNKPGGVQESSPDFGAATPSRTIGDIVYDLAWRRYRRSVSQD